MSFWNEEKIEERNNWRVKEEHWKFERWRQVVFFRVRENEVGLCYLFVWVRNQRISIQKRVERKLISLVISMVSLWVWQFCSVDHACLFSTFLFKPSNSSLCLIILLSFSLFNVNQSISQPTNREPNHSPHYQSGKRLTNTFFYLHLQEDHFLKGWRGEPLGQLNQLNQFH